MLVAKYFLFLLLFLYAHVGWAELGDRLVIAVNDTPYTQRQIEMYITVKESLRKGEHVRLIRPADWSNVVDVFTEDMIIFQESLRLGSFQPADPLVDRFAVAVKEKIACDQEFAAILKRLGVKDDDLRAVLEMVLRIDSYRRSKDRQDELAGQVRTASDQGKASWYGDLEDRAVIRMFRDAKIYKSIAPAG